MSLPRFIVLKSNYNKRYLGNVPPEEFKDIHEGVAPSRNSFLRFDRCEVSNTYTKFEVKPATIGNGLVHLKSCYNNKYWVRWSPTHWWIVVAADQPEEDLSKWSCTLFKLVYIDRNANTVRFIHLQLGRHASLLRHDPPFGDCLFGVSEVRFKGPRDVITVIDWESLSTSTSRPSGSAAAVAEDNNYIFDSAVDQGNGNSTSLPRFIVLKSNYNKRYLGYVPPEEFKDIHEGVAPSRNSFLRFDRHEVSTTYTKFEVTPAKIGNGLVHLKSCYNNKYWVRWSPTHYWIVAAADQPEEDWFKWSCTLFKLVYIDRNANTVRFIHLQLGHYASLSRHNPPFGDCLFGGSKDPDKNSFDVVTVIDWESLSTSTSRPGGSGAAVAEDNNYIFDSAVDQDYDNSTSVPSYCQNAIAFLKSDFMVRGTIVFSQPDPSSVTIIIKIKNIPYQIHALHILTYGDITRGSASSGQTFRDLGNFHSDDRTRKLERQITTKKISLIGEDSILGRTIVVYSESNPEPGAPLAWGKQLK